MKKKEYMKPAFRQIKIHYHHHLLIGSDPTKKMHLYDDEMTEETDVI